MLRLKLLTVAFALAVAMSIMAFEGPAAGRVPDE
jgi:hypothetical protein